MDHVIALVDTVRAVTKDEARLAEQARSVLRTDDSDAGGGIDRTFAGGHGEDVDLVSGGGLRPGQIMDVHLDATESGKVSVGDVENPHRTPYR